MRNTPRFLIDRDVGTYAVKEPLAKNNEEN